VWPENTTLLASETRWNRIYATVKIRRDIPEFQPTITLEESIPACVAWLEQEGQLEGCRDNDREDQIIASIDSLYRQFGTSR
jgi:hypothetical protein